MNTVLILPALKKIIYWIKNIGGHGWLTAYFIDWTLYVHNLIQFSIDNIAAVGQNCNEKLLITNYLE